MDKQDRKDSCPHRVTIIRNVEAIKYLNKDIQEIKADTKDIKEYTEKLNNGELSREMIGVTQNLAQAIIDNQSEQREIDKEVRELDREEEREEEERDFEQEKMELEYRVKFWKSVAAFIASATAFLKVIAELGWIF